MPARAPSEPSRISSPAPVPTTSREAPAPAVSLGRHPGHCGWTQTSPNLGQGLGALNSLEEGDGLRKGQSPPNCVQAPELNMLLDPPGSEKSIKAQGSAERLGHSHDGASPPRAAGPLAAPRPQHRPLRGHWARLTSFHAEPLPIRPRTSVISRGAEGLLGRNCPKQEEGAPPNGRGWHRRPPPWAPAPSSLARPSLRAADAPPCPGSSPARGVCSLAAPPTPAGLPPLPCSLPSPSWPGRGHTTL